MTAVVLGHGCITAAGNGVEALLAPPTGDGPRYVAGLDAEVEALGLRGTRPIARAARLACVAAGAALRQAGPLSAPPERCAVVLGTRYASITPLVEFARSAANDGPALVSPSAFPNVVANAHAGYLGILFQLAGPNVTLCGAEAGLDALAYGLDLIDLGRAEIVLAGGVESLGETIVDGLRRTGCMEPGEAAAFLLLGRSGAGPQLEQAASCHAGDGPGWRGADIVARLGDCGAAGGVLATILALRAAETTGTTQVVRGSAETLTVRRA